MLKISDLTASKNLDSKQMTDVRGGYGYYSAWGYTGSSAKAYPTIPNYGYSSYTSTSFGVTNPDI
jgi:hypothetical protein